MPVRSSVCTYSPSSASSGNSKYSSPVSSLGSIGHYRPLSSSSLNVNSAGSTYSRSTALESKRSPTTSYSGSRYTANSIYSPASSNLNTSYSSLSSNSSVASSTYRPLSSTHSSFVGSGTSRYNYQNSNSLSTPTTGYSTGHSRYSSSGSTGSASSLSSASSSLLANQTDGYYSSISANSYTNNYYPSSSLSRRLSHTQTHKGSSHDDLPPGVPRGLVNLGNTCYMNASLQSLYSIDSFRNLISNSTGRASYNQPLTSELSNLFKQILQSSSPVSPANFKCAFSRHQSKFSGLGQQDAQEFLRYLINGVHEEFNQAAKRARRSVPPRPPRTADEAWSQYREIVDDSPLVDLVVGQMCSTICCSICQNKSHCWDPFWDLSLPLTRGRCACKLSEVVQDFIAKETLDSDERPICSQCKRATRSTKQIELSRLPQLLILHLKKFTNDGYKMSSPEVRVDDRLVFNNITYQLTACISHHGHSSSSGHYTSHSKYSARWFHFNDDRVRDVTSSFDSLKLNDAYVLFYTQQGLTTTNQSKL